ncbi:unnamed protein product [marine sediment metagenome]|uniref:Uncharacterized protein n=1 Tax=marine sediment metagenome TaxID=412755 RepID=X1U2U6_9ZZZZ
MKQIVGEKEARLTYLKRQLAKRVSRSKFFDSHCHYIAPKSKMPVAVKKLIGEIETLEKDMGPRKAEELRAQVGGPRPRH